jgi:hypothetical protein
MISMGQCSMVSRVHGGLSCRRQEVGKGVLVKESGARW